VDYGDIHHPSRGTAFRVMIMADDFFERVYASIVYDASVTGERTAEAFMMLSCETFAKVTIDPDTRFDNKFFRTLLGRIEPKLLLSRRTLLGFARGEACASSPSFIYRDCHRACEAVSRSLFCVSRALCELDEYFDWSVAPVD
jgi:hypothetical protein